MATPATQAQATTFHGWRVASAAFVLAIFGWGLGFYGPPVFLKVLHEQRGWPIALIATAVTVHFLVGAMSGANVPALHCRAFAPQLVDAPPVAAPYVFVMAAVLQGLAITAFLAGRRR